MNRLFRLIHSASRATLTLALAGITLSAAAQVVSIMPTTPRANRAVVNQLRAVGTTWADSLSRLRARYTNWRYMGADTLSNPYYFPLLARPMYYDASAARRLGRQHEDASGSMLGIGPTLRAVDEGLSYVYTQQPTDVALHDADSSLPPDTLTPGLREALRPGLRTPDDWNEAAVDDHDEALPAGDNLGIIVRKPNFWKFSSNFSLQFMQNHFSDNWYQGGDSYTSLQAALTTEANLDNKRKIIFNNKLEMKLGFQTSPNDATHRYRSNSDQLRLTNKLGLRATKHWYYTFLLQSWTQFCRGYKSNDEYVYSDFMSPFESVFSIGMDYNLSVKNFNLTANIAPIACDFKYVGRKYLATSFGIDEGRHTKWELGSNITINYKWTVMKNVNWSGRIYYYTNYKNAKLEWENTINFVINRYLSSQLYLYPRFDDSVSRPEDGNYLQFKETLSVGLNVSF